MVYGFLTTQVLNPINPKVQIVPKFAAILASLLLIASSIGVNIERYPQVGRTIDAGQRTDAAEPVNSPPAAPQSGRVETANPDALPAREAEIEPAKPSQVATVPPAENARVEEASNPKQTAATAHSQPEPAATILDVRPMVPATDLPTAAGADRPAGADEVRRLPPLEPGTSAIAEPQAAASGAAVQYPATSTPF